MRKEGKYNWKTHHHKISEQGLAERKKDK